MRELHDIPDNVLGALLSAKQRFYQSLANFNIATLVQVYGGKDFVTRNLMLDVILITSQAKQGTRSFFAKRALYVSIGIQSEPILQMSRETFPELESLLSNNEVKSLFLTVCRTRDNRHIEEIYEGTLSAYLNSLYFTDIHEVLEIYGVTLTGRVVILDSETYTAGEHCEVLSKGYRIVSALHKFSHFLLRAPARNVKEFISTNSPTKTLRTDPPSETQVRRLIQLNFPLDDHGEAGYILERQFLGKDIKHINAAAAEKLLEMARGPKTLEVFQREFNEANSLPLNVSPQMRLERGHAGVGENTTVFGRCGMLQPWRD